MIHSMVQSIFDENDRFVMNSTKIMKIMKIIEIRENHIFFEINTNQDSRTNNGQKLYLIIPTPHKSTIAHPMMASDFDTGNAFIVYSSFLVLKKKYLFSTGHKNKLLVLFLQKVSKMYSPCLVEHFAPGRCP